MRHRQTETLTTRMKFCFLFVLKTLEFVGSRRIWRKSRDELYIVRVTNIIKKIILQLTTDISQGTQFFSDAVTVCYVFCDTPEKNSGYHTNLNC